MIKDEVNVQPHTMKGILCIILSVYIFMCIKGDVKEQIILQCMFIVIMFILSVTFLPPYTTTLLLVTCICWLLTKIFTLLEGEEVETSEDDKLLLIAGK